VSAWPVSNWYDALYANDPSTDNIFGREALAPRRNALLHEYLRLGGRLSAYARESVCNQDDTPSAQP
jgi:hypothetical protein